mgnify:CR=1 FL=1|nr:terminase large subunit [uncultured Tyzzerella sp.]
MQSNENYKIVLDYANKIISGDKIACKELKQACKRFIDDLKRKEFDFKTDDADFVINIIEKTFVHIQGERINGEALRGQPFLLEPFHKFIVYNLLGFFKSNTKERRFKEAFIFIPRKNIKTSFAGALAFALGILNRRSGSKIYIVGAALKQALESFNFIKNNIMFMEEEEEFRILDNNGEHSIQRVFDDGSLFIQALASSVDKQDSFNCNIAIADEIHAYKVAKQYNIIKEAMKAYTNKLMIGITTAGDDPNSFCYEKLMYCKSVLDNVIKDDSYFIFICKADEGENGEVDYTNPLIHEMANPAYNISIRPNDILTDSLQAQNSPVNRKDFLAKSLNIYTAPLKSYFNIDEFRTSNKNYNWPLEELAKLNLNWYGGVDLSKMHDLTASALYTTYNFNGVDIDICITHAFFPITEAIKKADEDKIPLYQWKEEGNLTLCNGKVTDPLDVVKWFLKMKEKGFKIKEIAHDRKFCAEYYILAKKAGFKIVDQPQYFHLKSQGFRRIERKVKEGNFYYLNSTAYEYCVQNVYAIEKTDDMIQYEKMKEKTRIDLFDASVFACVRRIEAEFNRKDKLNSWIK